MLGRVTLAVLVLAAIAERAAAQPPDVLVSRQLAQARGLEAGDVVTLAASQDGTRATQFHVAGVYEPLPDPARLTQRRLEVRMHLSDLISIAAEPHDPEDAEAVTRVNLALAPGANASVVEARIAALAPALSVQRTGRPDSVFVVLERFHLAISIVTVLGATAFLLALVSLRAEERRHVVGLLRILGVSRRRVLLGVLAEGVVIALAGAIIGVALAAATQGAVNAFFQWRYDTALVFVRVTPSLALRCVALAVPLGTLAGIVASWSLLRREEAASLLPR